MTAVACSASVPNNNAEVHATMFVDKHTQAYVTPGMPSPTNMLRKGRFLTQKRLTAQF